MKLFKRTSPPQTKRVLVRVPMPIRLTDTPTYEVKRVPLATLYFGLLKDYSTARVSSRKRGTISLQTIIHNKDITSAMEDADGLENRVHIPLSNVTAVAHAMKSEYPDTFNTCSKKYFDQIRNYAMVTHYFLEHAEKGEIVALDTFYRGIPSRIRGILYGKNKKKITAYLQFISQAYDLPFIDFGHESPWTQIERRWSRVKKRTDWSTRLEKGDVAKVIEGVGMPSAYAVSFERTLRDLQKGKPTC